MIHGTIRIQASNTGERRSIKGLERTGNKKFPVDLLFDCFDKGEECRRLDGLRPLRASPSGKAAVDCSVW